MRRLIYISRSLIGADPDALASIMTASAARNDLSGITGMLWCSSDTFAQALEGAQEAIEETFQRIAHDPRHSGIEIAEDREVSSRLFGRLSMVRADDSVDGISVTAYLTGLCSAKRTPVATKLRTFLLEHG